MVKGVIDTNSKEKTHRLVIFFVCYSGIARSNEIFDTFHSLKRLCLETKITATEITASFEYYNIL